MIHFFLSLRPHLPATHRRAGPGVEYVSIHLVDLFTRLIPAKKPGGHELRELFLDRALECGDFTPLFLQARVGAEGEAFFHSAPDGPVWSAWQEEETRSSASPNKSGPGNP
jgi:hypothetical protein